MGWELGAEWSSSFCPLAPCHEGGFVAARLPWLTQLPQPRNPTCATRWLLRAPGNLGSISAGPAQQGSDCDSYVIERGPSQGWLLLDGVVPSGNVHCSPRGLVALTKPAEARPRRPSGWEG